MSKNRILVVTSAGLLFMLRTIWPPVPAPAQSPVPDMAAHQPDPINQEVKDLIRDIKKAAEADEKEGKTTKRKPETKVIYKTIVKTEVKEKYIKVPVPVHHYKDTTMYFVDGKAVKKPTVIYRAAPVYKGNMDVFRPEMTTDKGLIHRWFKRKKK